MIKIQGLAVKWQLLMLISFISISILATPKEWWHTDSLVSISLSAASESKFISLLSTYSPHVLAIYVAMIGIFTFPGIILQNHGLTTEIVYELESLYRQNKPAYPFLDTFDAISIPINLTFFIIGTLFLFRELQFICGEQGALLVIALGLLSPVTFRHFSMATVETLNYCAFCFFVVGLSRIRREYNSNLGTNSISNINFVLLFSPIYVKLGNAPIVLLALLVILIQINPRRLNLRTFGSFGLATAILILPFLISPELVAKYLRTTSSFVMPKAGQTFFAENLLSLFINFNSIFLSLLIVMLFLALMSDWIKVVFQTNVSVLLVLIIATLTYQNYYPKYLIPLIPLMCLVVAESYALVNFSTALPKFLSKKLVSIGLIGLLASCFNYVNSIHSLILARSSDTRQTVSNFIDSVPDKSKLVISDLVRASATRGLNPISYEKTYEIYKNFSPEDFIPRSTNSVECADLIIIDDQQNSFADLSSLIETCNLMAPNRQLRWRAYTISPYTSEYDNLRIEYSTRLGSLPLANYLESQSKLSSGTTIDEYRRAFGPRFWLISSAKIESPMWKEIKVCKLLQTCINS